MVERVEHIVQQVIQALQAQGFLQENDTLVVAVSGGVDSVCLLHVLAGLQDRTGVKLHVAHLDHCLRGEESTKDAGYVAGLSRRLRLPATIETRDVAKYREQKRCSLEEAAREVRYQFLADVVKSTGAAAVAVGHTRNDHIETILMHLLRGTGTGGLRGLQSISTIHTGQGTAPLMILRPLLDISREETIKYCRAHRLRPRIDISNRSPEFLRNRIRNELLPVLAQYNPSIDTALHRLGTIAGADIAYIEEQSQFIWKLTVGEKLDGLYLDRQKMVGLPAALQRQIFRMALLKMVGNLRDFEADHIEEMIRFLSKPGGKQLDLPHGIRLYSQYDNMILSSSGKRACPFPPLEKEYAIAIPGETDLPGWHITAEIMKTDTYDGNPWNPYTAFFDLDKTGITLSVRPRKDGDRFQPLGMQQTRKLQDFMVDAKIPQHWRETIPLVISPSHMLWVVGWRIDERVKTTVSTKNVLNLTFEKTD
jgi:tRNA(Ile)-lysidine synthase